MDPLNLFKRIEKKQKQNGKNLFLHTPMEFPFVLKEEDLKSFSMSLLLDKNYFSEYKRNIRLK